MLKVGMDMHVAPSFQAGDGLLLVDPQNDFCPGGSLAVADGDAVMPVLTAWARAAAAAGTPVFVSRDWHPTRTTHFASGGGVWPRHCVIGTRGADFHPGLHLPAGAIVVSKGMGDTEDAYSAFQARDEHGAALLALVAERGIRHLYVMGLATDYCVKASALDAVEHGLRVTVVAAGVRAVNVNANDGEQALAEMRSAGVDFA